MAELSKVVPLQLVAHLHWFKYQHNVEFLDALASLAHNPVSRLVSWFVSRSGILGLGGWPDGWLGSPDGLPYYRTHDQSQHHDKSHDRTHDLTNNWLHNQKTGLKLWCQFRSILRCFKLLVASAHLLIWGTSTFCGSLSPLLSFGLFFGWLVKPPEGRSRQGSSSDSMLSRAIQQKMKTWQSSCTFVDKKEKEGEKAAPSGLTGILAPVSPSKPN